MSAGYYILALAMSLIAGLTAQLVGLEAAVGPTLFSLFYMVQRACMELKDD